MPTVFHATFPRLLRLTLIGALCAALSACALSPRVDREFGNSVRQAQAQQTLNPQARYNQSPVNGLDAQAASSAYSNYQKSYAQPEQQSNGFTIGVGSK